MIYPLLTWGAWLTSSGFGGTMAVSAALIAFLGVSRTATTQRENARKDQWWDRLKWAIDFVLSGDEDKANVGLTALAAITEAEGFDRDEWNFLRRIADRFLGPAPSGTLEQAGQIMGEEATDGDDNVED